MSLILSSIQDCIGVLTFNRPEKRNSFCNVMLAELAGALKAFEDGEVRVVIIRAQPGAPVWSAGFDIGELPEPGRDPLAYNDPIEVALRAVLHFRAPVIAMVEGSVWGGASDLCFSCDIAVGAPTATFAITPAKIGVPYNPSGIMHFLNTVGPRIAKEMFFTAAPLSAERALNVGILNYLVPAEDLEGFTFDLARRIAENSPLAIASIKEQLRVLSASHPLSPETYEKLQSLRCKAYESEDYVEGKKAFFEKRKPRFTGR
jgi:methylmalonyl-CoA decarboxylase